VVTTSVHRSARRVTATIGAAGGSIASVDNRLKITIPAGALAGNTTIGIQPISATAPAGINYGYPPDTRRPDLRHPITLTYTPTPGDLDNTTPAAVGLAFQTATQTWQVMPGTRFDDASNTFSTSTTHFTDYNYFASFPLVQLRAERLLTAGTGDIVGGAGADRPLLRRIAGRLPAAGG